MCAYVVNQKVATSRRFSLPQCRTERGCGRRRPVLVGVGGQQVVRDVQRCSGAICGGKPGPVGGDDGGADWGGGSGDQAQRLDGHFVWHGLESRLKSHLTLLV